MPGVTPPRWRSSSYRFLCVEMLAEHSLNPELPWAASAERGGSPLPKNGSPDASWTVILSRIWHKRPRVSRHLRRQMSLPAKATAGVLSLRECDSCCQKSWGTYGDE